MAGSWLAWDVRCPSATLRSQAADLRTPGADPPRVHCDVACKRAMGDSRPPCGLPGVCAHLPVRAVPRYVLRMPKTTRGQAPSSCRATSGEKGSGLDSPLA